MCLDLWSWQSQNERTISVCLFLSALLLLLFFWLLSQASYNWFAVVKDCLAVIVMYVWLSLYSANNNEGKEPYVCSHWNVSSVQMIINCNIDCPLALPQSAFSEGVAEAFAPLVFPGKGLFHGHQRYGRGSPVSLFIVLNSTNKWKLKEIKWSRNDLRWLIFHSVCITPLPSLTEVRLNLTLCVAPWPAAPLCVCLLQPVTPPSPQSELMTSGSWRRRCSALCFLLKTRFAPV